MCLPHRTLFCAVFLFVVGVQVETKKSGPYVCPIKFKLVYNRDNGNYVCYKQKEPEEFADKFKNCNGNMYTEILYRSLNISKFDEVDRVWADYKSTYPGGPFVSTSEEKIVYNGTFTPDYDFIYQELCLTVNQFGYYRAVRCDEKYYRYCIVKPYPDTEVAMDKTGCNEFHQSWRFISPRDLCLYNVTGHGGGPVRATWNQSQALCTKNGGSLLSEGIQYANFPMFHKTNESPIPVRSPSKLRQAGINETTGLAITRDFWEIEKINSSVIFFDVICENSVQRRNIFLNLTLESDKILVITNNTVYKRNIHCYTNSETYYPTKVKIHDKKKNISDYNIYKLSPDYDGHYWCVHIDPENLQETESQKLLFLRPKYLFGRYAIKIRLENAYIFENADMIKDNWEERLERYIVYTTKNNIENFENVNITELEKDYIINNDSNMDDNDVISDIKIRRMYIDMRTILFHAQVREDMIPLNPLKLEDADVLFMKPVHICSSRNTVPRLIINKSITLSDCITYKCVGEFDEGVSLVEEATPDCIINTSVAMTGLTIEVRKNEPTSTLPPFEIDDLELTTIQTRLNLRDQASSEEYNDYELTETTYASTTVTEDVSTVTSSTYEYTITETDGVFTPIDSTTTVTTPIEDTTVDTSTEITSTERRPFPPPIIPPLPTTVIPVTTLPSLAPEEQLEQVLNDLDTLLQNDSVQITVEKIEETFDQVNELFDIDQDLQIPGTLLHMLDDLGSKLYLNGSSTGATVRNNIALLVADAAPDNPVRGFRLANTDLDSNFTGDTFQFLAEEINTTHLMANKSEAVVYLPESVTSTPRRLSFVIFRNERAFRCTRNAAIVNSKVVSVNVGNMTTFENGEVIDIHLTPLIEETDRNNSRTCAYWKFIENGTGYWSTEGCTFIKSTEFGILDTCRCNHLTHFAEVLIPRTLFSQRNEDVLEILSIVGCCLSMFGVILILLTAVMFRAWRREFSNKIWLQLCFAIFLISLCFLIVVFVKFDGYDVPCMLVGVMLHYSVLASFCWMLVAAIISYRRLVLVFTREMSHKLLKASAFSWGAPFAVVGVLLSVDPLSYAGQYEEKSPSGNFCYPSGLGLWLAVYAPVAVMLLANWTLFILIVRSVFASRRIQRHGDANDALRCASVSCLLVFLFGLPWIFGLFANNIVAAYFFTCTVTLQGFVLFIFIVVFNKKTRDLWLNKLKIKQTRKIPVTSSTYTNRTMGGESRERERSSSSMEANNLKPRSLASPDDDSKFS